MSEEKREMDEHDDAPGLVVPLDRLNAEVLNAVIDEFVSREGTDYGHAEPEFEQKLAQVRRQLERGDAFVVFDPKTESVNIVTARELERPEGG